MAYQSLCFSCTQSKSDMMNLGLFFCLTERQNNNGPPLQVLLQYFVLIISSLCMHANVAQKFLVLTTPAEMIFYVVKCRQIWPFHFFGIFVCSQSGYHIQMWSKKSFIIIVYFGYTLKTKYKNLAIFLPHFLQLKTSKITSFFFLNLNFLFSQNFA